ncbi:MAG: ribose-phosphate pyrophosphokinase [Calditrichaeota bacterium]|nr:ribose-phosphate pyrophosphokinase [Calditrichota bacterium]
MKLFSGSAHPALADSIAGYLELPAGAIDRRRFSDGEFWVKYQDNIRGSDVFLVQPTHPPAENLIELLIMADAARRSSAARITAVIPYFGYARQDRKDQPRVAITARLMANLIEAATVDRVLTMDLHTPQLQGFFNIPVDHLYSSGIFIDHFRRIAGDNLVVISPDVGGIALARAYAQRLGAGLAFIDKRRSRPNDAKGYDSEVMNVIGEVEGRVALIIDDIVDTAGTICKAAQKLRDLGCTAVHAACTHPLLSGRAVEKISDAGFEQFVVSDTIPLKDNARESGIFTVLSVAGLFGEAIKRIHVGESLSVLFT